jgi:hypothetical protein
VWRELMVAYPGAKSTIDTIYFTENRWQFKLMKYVSPFMNKMSDMTHKLVWQRNHRGTMDELDSPLRTR